jgi:ABC-2 type transport system permease protein
MRKILIIARREYLAAVKTKAFIVSLVLMPVLMGGSIALQSLVRRMDDTKEKTYAVIDRTPGAKIAAALVKDVEFYNTHLIDDPETGARSRSRIKLELVAASSEDSAAIAQQRYELSQRVEHDDLEAFVDIPADAVALQGEGATKAGERPVIRMQKKKPGEGFTANFFERRINEAIQRERFAQEKYDVARIRALQQPVLLKSKGLTTKSAKTGEIMDAPEEQQIANFLLPAAFIGLMFMVIMTGATPAMQGIIEEKSQRIAEVLLGSVSPFQLMAGKLLGVLGISLTTATLYFAGAYFVASRYGLTENLTAGLIVSFFFFLILALLIFGSIFIAIGAAAQDVKDTQTLLTPVMVLVCLPLFLTVPILSDPHGKIAVAASLFPTSAPMILVARQSVPPGVPAWQLGLGVAIVLATTVVCIWTAGRIFRVGFLMQGKSAKLKDLVQWVLRG